MGGFLLTHTMTKTARKIDIQSFAAGVITASITFLLPILLLPNTRATYMGPIPYDYPTYDVDMDGVTDMYDTSFEAMSSPEVDASTSVGGEYSSEQYQIDDYTGVNASVDAAAVSSESFQESAVGSAGENTTSSSVVATSAADICADGIDNDGDSDIDGLDADCDRGTSSISSVSVSENCGDGIDNDGDGDSDGLDSDCM